jgi:hypothetical protein
MLISEKNKFVLSPFASEDELTRMVTENPDYFFGPSSFCLPKELISDSDGFEVFTDGFAVDISTRQWFVVSTTLAKHNVWSHIAPQVVRQLIAAEQLITKQLLTELVIQQLKINEEMMKKFSAEGFKKDESTFLSQIHSLLGEIFEKTPLIGIPIDSISNDLRDWAVTLKANVKLCVVKKFVENGNSENIIYEIPENSVSAESGDGYLKNTKIDKIAKDNEKSQTTVLDRLTEKIEVSEIPY